ncbi:MAG: metallophosphoesterase [Candidatus Kapaibacterium sp.]
MKVQNSYSLHCAIASIAMLLLLSCGSNQEFEDTEEIVRGKKVTTDSISANKFLAISDVHFDPYYDPTLFDSLVASDPSEWKRIFEGSAITTLSTYHADANYPLLRSSLEKMKAVSAKPDFIVIAGDLLAHDFQSKCLSNPGQDEASVQLFIAKTLTFLKLMIEETYPGVPVFSALGNNDAYCGDYMVQPNSPFLQMVANLWKPMLHSSDTASFDATFKEGGYYSVASPTDTNLRIIVLNTIFMSNQYNLGKHGVFCANVVPQENHEPGKKLLTWLEGELAAVRAKGKRVWIVQHIPPGVDTYGSLKSLSGAGCIGNPVFDMDTSFNRRYIDILRNHADLIAANFAGHYHRDDFRLIPDSTGKTMQSSMLYFPSISPVNSNNPGFKVVDYNPKNGQLLDYTVYYANVANSPEGNLSAWSSEYRFSDVYREKEITTASLTKIYRNLDTNQAMQMDYLQYYPVSKGSSPFSQFRAYWCIVGNVTAEGVRECSCGS